MSCQSSSLTAAREQSKAHSSPRFRFPWGYIWYSFEVTKMYWSMHTYQLQEKQLPTFLFPPHRIADQSWICLLAPMFGFKNSNSRQQGAKTLFMICCENLLFLTSVTLTYLSLDNGYHDPARSMSMMNVDMPLYWIMHSDCKHTYRATYGSRLTTYTFLWFRRFILRGTVHAMISLQKQWS